MITRTLVLVLGTLALAGATFAVASSATPPPRADLEAIELVSEMRTELTSIEREIDQREREQAVAERVIELASADLEDAEGPEARRIRRIVRQYRERIQRTERDRAKLEAHHARLAQSLSELEASGDAAARRLAEHDAEQAIRERERRIRALHERVSESRRDRTGDDESDRDRAIRERQIALNQIEAMRLALPAFLEADDQEAAERLEIAIRLRELVLERRDDDDDEVRELRRIAPDREELRSLLGLAAELWREIGHEGRAETIARMIDANWSDRPHRRRERELARDRDQERPRDHDGDRREAMIDRIERLQEHLEHVHRMVESMHDELEDLKRTIAEPGDRRGG